ncbi:MAG: hypothetical protein U9N46_11940 [Euryarchaeota archaeon]|nr:hypothetical protein [Euryarchaeota archaeon]
MLTPLVQTINMGLAVCIMILTADMVRLTMRIDMSELSVDQGYMKRTWIVMLISAFFLFLLAVYQLLISEDYDLFCRALLTTAFMWFLLVSLYMWHQMLYGGRLIAG